MDAALKLEEYYTYDDYAGWDTGERYELIDGVPYMMSAPSQIHQSISRELTVQLGTFLKGKTCSVFAAPFDVRLNAGGYDDTVVQPDLLVVCDRAKLNGKCCVGAPDMVIEILSPSSARMDRMEKMKIYQKAGVREYWIVEPENKMVQAFLLENGKYVVNAYGDEETAPVSVLDGCGINLGEVFAEVTAQETESAAETENGGEAAAE